MANFWDTNQENNFWGTSSTPPLATKIQSNLNAPVLSKPIQKTGVDLVSNKNQIVQGGNDLIKGVLQGTARSGANIGQGIVTGGKDSTVIPQNVPGSKILFGTDKPFSFSSETAPITEAVGISPESKTGKIVNPILGFGLAASDLFTGGAGKKALTTALTEAKDVKTASNVLKKAGFSEDIVNKYADVFAKTSDVKQVENTLNSLNKGNFWDATASKSQPQDIKAPLQKSSQSEPLLKKTSTEISQVKSPSTLETQSLRPEGNVSSSLTRNLPQDFNADKYISEQVAKREKARVIESPTLGQKGKSFLQEAKTKLVDFTAPIEDVLNQTVKKNKIKLLPSEDIHNQIDRVLRAPTLAGQFAKDNGIVKVIKSVDNPDALDQYLIAKHAIELDAQGVKTGRDLAKDRALISSLGEKYSKEAQTISTYSQKLLDYAVETGLVSKDTASMLKKKYPDYVPFNRVFSEEEQGRQFGSKAVASLGKQTAVQKIVGSDRQIESPLESLLAKTNDVIKQGEKNKAAKLLTSYEKLPGNPFELKELKEGEKGDYTVSFFENGMKKTFSTTKEVEQAAKLLDVQQLSTIGKILAFPTRVARLGITGINLPFVGANIAKDQISAFINSDKGLKTSIANPYNFGRALFSALKHDDLYQEMVRAGGAGTSFDIARDQAKMTIGSIRSGRSIPSRVAYVARHPGELLRAVEDIVGRSEEFTRIKQYRGTKQALLKQGLPEKEAVIGGARSAREDTVNFARRGEWGTVLNSMLLYLNAGIQGTRTLLRNLKTKPVQTASKIAVSSMLPMAYATSWNLSDKKRKEAYDDIPDYEKEGNFIIIPNNPKKDQHGKWNVIKVPISQEINNLLTIVRKQIEATHGGDPVKFKDFTDSLLGTVSPIKPDKGSILSSLTPQALKPSLEAGINKSLFTGNPIIPDSLKNLSPENQVKKDTSGTARIIAKKINVSPIQVEAWIKSTFGGVGTQALNAVDQALAKTGTIPSEQVGGQSVLEGITARFQKAQGGNTENKVYGMLNEVAQQKADYKQTTIRPIYDKTQALIAEGKQSEADALVSDLSDTDYEIYKSIKTAEKTKQTLEGQRNMVPLAKKAKELINTGKQEEANALIKDLTDEEYKWYLGAKKKLE